MDMEGHEGILKVLFREDEGGIPKVVVPPLFPEPTLGQLFGALWDPPWRPQKGSENHLPKVTANGSKMGSQKS